MKKTISIFVFIVIFGVLSSFSQSVGFSYFFPKYGYFSNPIAPVNMSLPVKAGKFFQISPGIGMYNIGGMSMTGFAEEFNSQRPLIGPFQSLELSLLPALVLPFKTFKIDFAGGVFGFWAFNQKLNYSEFNEMVSEAYNYTSISSNVNHKKNGFGWGYIYGVKLSFKVAKNAWGYIGANYYNGSQLIKMNGNYKALSTNNDIINGSFETNNTKLLYHGLQISVGAILK